MRNLQGSLTAMLLVISGTAYSSNWQYAGYTEAARGNAQMFFDEESVTRPNSNTVRVWIKSILATALDRYFERHQKQPAKESATKLVTEYVPQFLMLPAIEKKYSHEVWESARIDLTLSEIEANSPDILTESKMYFEIDCNAKQIRMLDLMLFDKHGIYLKAQRVGVKSGISFHQIPMPSGYL